MHLPISSRNWWVWKGNNISNLGLLQVFNIVFLFFFFLVPILKANLFFSHQQNGQLNRQVIQSFIIYISVCWDNEPLGLFAIKLFSLGLPHCCHYSTCFYLVIFGGFLVGIFPTSASFNKAVTLNNIFDGRPEFWILRIFL